MTNINSRYDIKKVTATYEFVNHFFFFKYSGQVNQAGKRYSDAGLIHGACLCNKNNLQYVYLLLF